MGDLRGKVQRDCYRLLTTRQTYGTVIKLECTRFEFLNEFLPGVYVEVDVCDPFTGTMRRRIVPRGLARELQGLPPLEYPEAQRARDVETVARVETVMQERTAAEYARLVEEAAERTRNELFPKKVEGGAYRRELTEEQRFDDWLRYRSATIEGKRRAVVKGHVKYELKGHVKYELVEVGEGDAEV